MELVYIDLAVVSMEKLEAEWNNYVNMLKDDGVIIVVCSAPESVNVTSTFKEFFQDLYIYSMKIDFSSTRPALVTDNPPGALYGPFVPGIISVFSRHPCPEEIEKETLFFTGKIEVGKTVLLAYTSTSNSYLDVGGTLQKIEQKLNRAKYPLGLRNIFPFHSTTQGKMIVIRMPKPTNGIRMKHFIPVVPGYEKTAILTAHEFYAQVYGIPQLYSLRRSTNLLSK